MFDSVWPHRRQPTRLPSLGFSRQEHWSGLPFPPPMHESEKWKWSRSVVSNSSRPHGLQRTRLLHPWGFPGKSTGVGCHCHRVQYFDTQYYFCIDIISVYNKNENIQLLKNFYMNVHSSIIHNSQKIERTCLSTDEWRNTIKSRINQTYNRILFSN